jgi:hypothetical protein
MRKRIMTSKMTKMLIYSIKPNYQMKDMVNKINIMMKKMEKMEKVADNEILIKLK